MIILIEKVFLKIGLIIQRTWLILIQRVIEISFPNLFSHTIDIFIHLSYKCLPFFFIYFIPPYMHSTLIDHIVFLIMRLYISTFINIGSYCAFHTYCCRLVFYSGNRKSFISIISCCHKFLIDVWMIWFW